MSRYRFRVVFAGFGSCKEWTTLEGGIVQQPTVDNVPGELSDPPLCLDRSGYVIDSFANLVGSQGISVASKGAVAKATSGSVRRAPLSVPQRDLFDAPATKITRICWENRRPHQFMKPLRRVRPARS